MKNYPVIALAALSALCFTACDEYTLPNPPAQSNPAEPVFNSSDLTVTNLVDGTIDLPALREAGKPVSVLKADVKNFPSSYELQFVAQMSATDDFAKSTDIKCVNAADGDVTIPVSEMQTAFNTLVSKDLVAKDIYVRIAAYAVSGTSSVRLGGSSDYYYFNGKYTVLPLPQENVIETGYYLVGSFCNWDIKKGIPFTHIGDGNVYDYPDFSLKIDVTLEEATAEGGYQWKVVPASGYANSSWEGAFGAVAGDSATKGNLVDAPEAQANAGAIKQEGPYMIKINMETRKYEVSPAFDYLWVPGRGSSQTDFNRILRLATTDFITYEGTMRLNNRFWFTGQASLKGVSFRPDGEDNPVGADGVLSGKMMYDPNSSTYMRVPTAGLYYIKANVVTLEWSATPIPVISAIGGFNGWDTATAPDLTPNANKDVWTVKDLAMTAGEFKFCVSHAWTLSYGGTADNIVQNGGNLNIAEDGKYDIELHFDAFPAYVKITKK